MKVNFRKIILHNFISFSHSEIDLTNKYYCLVSGVNNCPLDNTISNGSGKSSIWSGITYALTGETISGLKDVKNKFIDEKSCYVSLEFSIDNDDYVVTRFKEPNSDLKIIKNKEDISGKGIRDSSIVLSQNIPDLTFDLISSVILIGQGMPNKLSGRTPSGRKELLEKLSKSDFMIEDVKKRITERSNYLYAKQRNVEDALLTNNTSINVNTETLRKYQAQLENLEIKPDFDKLLEESNNRLCTYTEQIKALEENFNRIQDGLNDTLANINELKVRKANDIAEYNNKKQESLNNAKQKLLNDTGYLQTKVSELTAIINVDEQELKKLQSITDVCPTCGQKLIGVEKPDTTPLENKLESEKKELALFNDELANKTAEYNEEVIRINKYNSLDIHSIETQYKEAEDNNHNLELSYRTQLTITKSGLEIAKDNKTKEEINYNNILNDKNNYIANVETLESNIEEYQAVIDSLISDKEILEKEQSNIKEHLDVIKKFDTLIKRDFRGYLLQNIITYIDNKAKEYCPIVFGSNQIEFKLDGNNIDITYCNKEYEGLSGGEKQKVDLIIQFALRDLMSKYLGFSSNILILDEIFDNLDAQGVANVINLISTSLSDIESIFIISHHSDELQLNYDTEIKVIKDVNGVSEVK